MPTSVTQAQGASIVSWLQGRLTNTIGRGECWDAAENAIQSVGARRPNASQLYVWGAVILPDSLQPGDVLQFSHFVSTVTTETDSSIDSVDIELGTPRHTAIVASINANGSVNLLHQNFMGDRFVTSLPNVFIRAKSMTSVTVTVRGTVTCYRPRIP